MTPCRHIRVSVDENNVVHCKQCSAVWVPRAPITEAGYQEAVGEALRTASVDVVAELCSDEPEGDALTDHPILIAVVAIVWMVFLGCVIATLK